MKQVIGIDRKIKRAWLDATLDCLSRTTDAGQLRQFVDEQLKGELPGQESRKKSVGIVLRIWSGIPARRIRLRDRAVALLPTISGQDRLWLHWGMTALAYPFFRSAAEVIGRLLALQDDFTTAQVQARLLPTWGDTATTRQAAQKLVPTLVDWEVLRATETKGHFLLAKKMPTASQPVQLWLLEALLGASASDEVEAQQLLRLPEAFPFNFTVGVPDLRRHEGFDVHREGLDMEKVALRKVPVEQPAEPEKKQKKAKKKKATVQPGLFDRQPEVGVSVNGQGWTVTDVPFAAPAAECARLLKADQHYGCVALALAVTEEIVLHVWRVKVRKRKNYQADFETALKALHTNGIISEERRSEIDRMWADRHTFSRLRPSVDAERLRLEHDAAISLGLLKALEKQFFGYSERGDVIVPEHPEYWTRSAPCEERGCSVTGAA